MMCDDDMGRILAEEEILRLTRRTTVIGDIAILSLPAEFDAYLQDIAEAIIARRKNIHTVLNKVTGVGGDHRIARYRLLAGNWTITVHREFGFSYSLDVREVFFNPRLASERRRVASQVSAGENVLVPFAGVGPFVVPVAPCVSRWVFDLKKC